MAIDNYAVRTLYAELLDLCEAQRFEALPAPVSFTTKIVRGHRYYYAQYADLRDGRQRQAYLGADTPALRARIDAYRDRQREIARDAAPRIDLARAIIAAGGQGPDARAAKLLQFLETLGLFQAGGVVVGSHVYASYINQLGVRLPDHETLDPDIAASVQVAFASQPEPLEALLRRFDPDFIPVPTLARRGAALSTSFRVRGAQLRLDLLVPLLGRPKEESILIPAFGAHAAPMRYLDYLTEHTQSTVLLAGPGVLVNAPPPERYALHKLIVAAERPAAMQAKCEKDVRQARTLIEWFIEFSPDTLHEAARAMARRRDGWRRRVARSLLLLPENARCLLSNWLELTGGGGGDDADRL